MNNQIFFFFYNLAHRSELFDKLVVFVADIFPYILLVLSGVFLLFFYKILPSQNPFREFVNKWRLFLPILLTFIFALASSVLLKLLFHTERPFTLFREVVPLLTQTDHAFPSGHTLIFTALAFAVLSISKKAGYIFLFFAVLIGISRIVAGVHFPVDIFGGFIFGFLVYKAVAYFFKRI